MMMMMIITTVVNMIAMIVMMINRVVIMVMTRKYLQLLLLEAKSKYLEESYKSELKELKQQLKNMESDDAVEKLTKKKIKASLTYKMKKVLAVML